MKYVLPLALLAGLLFLALGYILGRESTPQSPNVLFITMDTLRSDRIAAVRNGQPVMPFLSRAVNEGAHFTRAISPCSWTKPAMASIFTGVSPEAHGVIYTSKKDANGNDASDVLSPEWMTLAEWLRVRGYSTWAYISNANLEKSFGFAQGFDAADYVYKNGASAPEVTDAALGKLSALKPPFLLYAHYMDPHSPYTPPALHKDALGPFPQTTAYDNTLLDNPMEFMRYYMDCAKIMLGLQEQPTVPPLSPGGQAAVEHLYDAEVRFMDEAIERLVTAVRKSRPNTLVVLVSDHGEEFWERGGMGHGTTLFQEQVHVPLVLMAPDIAPRKIDTTVSTLDLLPTFAAYLKIPGLSRWEGRGLLAPSEPRPVFAFSKASEQDLQVHIDAIYEDGHVLIQDHGHGWERLFRHETDPGEQQDIAASDPARAAAMREKLEAHIRQSRAALNAVDRVETVIDPAIRAQQKDLGY
ncbi:MAG: sulfatase [Candidatus Hydrogenedentes bacterium]|nr:sulfatase [Candidatus Hydrogenedentota bacterium]